MWSSTYYSPISGKAEVRILNEDEVIEHVQRLLGSDHWALYRADQHSLEFRQWPPHSNWYWLFRRLRKEP